LNYETNGFNVEGGLSFRHQIDGPGASRAAFPHTVSSTEWHYGYLGVAYTTKPIRALLNTRFMVGVTGEYQPVDQHVAVERNGRVAYINENPHQNQYYDSTETVGVTVPVGKDLNVSYQESFGAVDFYENAPFPYHWDGFIVVDVTKKFNEYFSLTLRDQRENFAPQGAPLPYPNATHIESISVLADFHLDLNKVVHHPK